MTTTRTTLATLGALALAACASAPGSEDERRPNIVLILADDVGVEAFGCYGGESYATPHIDGLAAQGLRFANAHSQPVCTPSRVKILTGRSNLRNYVRFSILDPNERTFAHVLRDAGYATGVVGKWQLYGAEHYAEWAGQGAHPRDAGFDEWCLWQLDRLGSRYADPTIEFDGEVREDLAGEYGPDVFATWAEEFLERHADEPFLLYFPMALVHSPFEPTPLSDPASAGRQARFADMMEYMDAIVGRLDAKLDELGLREDTLFVFTSDNGTGRNIVSVRDGREVRGGKAGSTDTATHVPLVVSWPGTAPAGAVSESLVEFSDFLPTLADVAGAAVPGDRILDGVSFASELRGGAASERAWIVCFADARPGTPQNPRVFFLRDARYKLYDDGRFFDLGVDPNEERALPAAELSAEQVARRNVLATAMASLPGPQRLDPGAPGPGDD